MRPGVIGGIGAACIAALLATASLAAAAPQPRGEKLSPRLAALAESQELRSAAPRKQAARLDVAPEGEGSLLRYGERLVVEVRFAGDAQAGADQLQAVGVEVLGVSPNYDIVTAAIALASLQDVAQVPGVEAATEQLTPATSQVAPVALGGSGCAPAATSEGDAQLRANLLRATYSKVNGSGVEVGILSDSFDSAAGTNAAADVASGDLPGPGNPCGRTTRVDVLEDLPPSTDPADEGRAMAQLVHDLAPRAGLSFATGFAGLFDMARNIRQLANAGAKVIVDDVTWPQEPFFQAGPIDNAIEDVTQKGVVYFSSAGNSNDRPGSRLGSWETPEFRPTGDCPALSLPAQDEDCLDFDPAPGVANEDRGLELTVANGGALPVILQWAEPWSGVETDLDLYLVDSTNRAVAASTQDNIGFTQRPFEAWSWTNNTGSPEDVRLVVNRASGTETPRVKLRTGSASGITFNEYASPDQPDAAGPTIMGHNGAADAISAAAVPFDDPDSVEAFSSRGPVSHYFRPVNGTVPAQPRSPLVLDKPDLAATDCAQNTFFGPFFDGEFRFCGTSAAAPHAAAVAALQLDATPRAGPGQIRAAQMNTAVPVGPFPPEAAGAGLVDALTAVEVDDDGPGTTITGRPNGKTGKRKATFNFSAEPRASYECKLDQQPWKGCSSGVTYKKLKRGTHHFRVRATDQLGNAGQVASDKWRRVRR